MSEIKKIIQCFQSCDLCHKEIPIPNEKASLTKITLPMDFYSDRGKVIDKTVTASFSCCENCLKKVKSLLSLFWEIYEIDYGGVVVKEKTSFNKKNYISIKDELIPNLKLDKEWAEGNEWEAPICLNNDLEAAINILENYSPVYEIKLKGND